MFTKRIYMDYAAGAPEVREARNVRRKAERVFANASSIHKDGVAARGIVEDARKRVASVLHAHADEIVFTESGTESDNLAVMGTFKHARLSAAFANRPVHIITTVIEHPAVLEACRHLERVGAQVTYLPVSPEGLIDLKDLRAALTPDTVMVSVCYANSEIGVVQPIREIAKEIRHFKKHSGTEASAYPLLHTDACQASPLLSLNVEQLGVDMLTFSGIKLGAGQGASVLYVRRSTPIDPIMYGGEQERGLRPGTENVPAIAALATALDIADKTKASESVRLAALRDYFFAEVARRFPNARTNGSTNERLPSNVHISFPNIASELLVLELDARSISASAGSACSASDESESKVLAALYGAGDGKKWGSVRFSFGRETSKGQIGAALNALETIFKKYETIM